MALPMAPGEATIAVETKRDSPKTHRRFDRAARLFGEPGLHLLMDARIVIFGAGGVGSFAAEALARSGVGELVLVDFDDVCVTNTNRQLHALKGNIGKAKVEIMAERLRLINPLARFTPVAEFYQEATSENLLDGKIDFVVDAIDNLKAKAHLIATCVERGIPVVSSMGAAARLDPTAIRTDDLSETQGDRFARAFRKLLRKNHGIDARAGSPIGVHAVYSVEPSREPIAPAYDDGKGFRCVCPGGNNGLHTCDARNRIDGSAAFVTGAFGLACASVVVRELIATASAAEPAEPAEPRS